MSDPAVVALPVDAHAYTVQDGAGTVRSAPVRWRWLVEGLDDLPQGVVVGMGALGEVLREAGGDGDDLAALAAGVDRRLKDLAREVGPTAGLVAAVGEHDPLVTAVTSVDSLLSGIGRTLAGEHVAPATGSLARIGASRGGVPKSAVDAAQVTASGLSGDRQAVRRHHGRPSQALSLWSAEVIAALAAEGHPVGPGGAGENLTIAGLDWSALRPGARLELGPGGAVAELTGWCDPCATIAGCFTGRDFRRIDHDRHPGWSRAYAAVVSVGPVAAGDEVRVLP